MSATNELSEAFREEDPTTANAREILIGSFQQTARWRREKADEFSEDARNLEAADLLENLADTVDQVDDHLLHRYGRAIDHGALSFRLIETQYELLRQIGFHTAPTTAEKIVEHLLEKADEILADFEADDEQDD